MLTLAGEVDVRERAVAVLAFETAIAGSTGPWPCAAFDVRPGDRLYLPPAQRVSFWGAD